MRSPDALVAEIHGCWQPSAPVSFTVEVPPGCGASWIARQLADPARIHEECPSADAIVVCRLDGATVRDDWRFVRRLAREWGAGAVLRRDDPEYAMIEEDRDASDLLRFVSRHLNEHGKLPVLVVGRFHSVARGLDVLLSEMRMLEQDGRMCTVAMIPVSPAMLKQRWQNEGVFFATSNYGDNHETRYMGALPPDYAREFATQHESGKQLLAVVESIERILGRRAVSYARGLSVWCRLRAESTSCTAENRMTEFEERLLAEARAAFHRLLKWVDPAGSRCVVRLIADVRRGDKGAAEVAGRTGGRWADILWSEDGVGLSCVGLGVAAEEYAHRAPAVAVPEAERQICDLCSNLRYRDGPVSPSDVHEWLSQFSEGTRDTWLFLLEQMVDRYFFSQKRLEGKLEQVYLKARRELGKLEQFASMRPPDVRRLLRIVEVCGPQKSEGRILHEFCLVNGIRREGTWPRIEEVLNEASRNLDSPYVLVAVDDFVGSGESARDYLRNAAESTHPGSGGKWPENVILLYLAAVGFADGKAEIERAAGANTRVILGRTLGDADRLFSDRSSLLCDPALRERLRRECEDIGRALYPKHPLGYRDCGCMVVFHYDVPNNTLPVLFEPGTYHGKPWLPLFRRPDARG